MIKECKKCKASYNIKPSRFNKSSYCSHECQWEDQRITLLGKGNPNYKGSVKKECAWCKVSFSVIKARSGAKYCSRKCRDEYWSDKGIKRLKAKKLKAYIEKLHLPVTRLYTAKKCGHLAVKGRTWCPSCSPSRKFVSYKVCKECKIVYSSKNKSFCSRRCYSKEIARRQKGSKSHLWKGGKTSENMILRGSREAKEWRKKVFARDDYTCQHCGIRGGKLDADHIKPWATHPELRFDINNGRTLCRTCHIKTDTWGYKATLTEAS